MTAQVEIAWHKQVTSKAKLISKMPQRNSDFMHYSYTQAMRHAVVEGYGFRPPRLLYKQEFPFFSFWKLSERGKKKN